MAYGFYRSITIDHTKCGASSSSSFPVLVSISGATSVKTVANGGRINNTGTQSGGVGGTIPFDLVFSSDNAGASKYPWEIESYDPVAGTLVAWVQVPTVSNAADTVFYMVYGDAAVNTQQNTGSLSPANVWDTNFKGVWHLPSSSVLSDSTSNANNGTNAGTVSATGQIDGAVNLNGGYITAGSNASLMPGGNFSISVWANRSGNGAGALPGLVVSAENSGTAAGFILCTSANAPKLYVDQLGGGGSYATVTASAALALNTWTFVEVTFDGSFIRMYVNGSQDGAAVASTFAHYSSPFTIPTQFGRYATSSLFGGLLDEIRISGSLRSADWILTEYNNQNAPGNIGTAGFLTFGAETAGGAASLSLFRQPDLSGLGTGGPFFKSPI